MNKKSNTGLDYWPKVQHIVPAYAAIGILTVTGLIVIRWMFVEYLPGIEIKEDLWEIWIPMVFPIIPVAIWLRRRIKILSFESSTDDRQFFFLMIAVFSMALPSIIAQNFVLRAMADLHEVPSVNAIDVQRPNRYYAISEFDVVENMGGAHADVRASGKHNQYLNFDFFFAFSITEPGRDPGRERSYWYGIKHHEQISNRLTDEEKERLYKEAYQDGIDFVEGYDFRDQEYFEVVQASDDRDNYRKAAESRSGVSWEIETVILTPGDGAFANRTGEKFDWIFLSSGIGFAVFLLFLIWPTYDEKELRRQRRGEMPKGELFAGFKEFFIPRDDYFAAPIIMDAIILAFLIVTFSGVHAINPSGGDLLEWGANRRAETTGGQWWRLVTSMFLHGGIMHLFLNMYGLLLAAIFVEPIFGRTKFFVIYFLSGIFGSLASIWWYENTVSVGASGAIFGLFGAIFSLAAMGVMRFQDLTWLWIFIGINLLFGLTGGIDNAAHLGGLLSGTIVGFVLQLVSKLRHEEPSP